MGYNTPARKAVNKAQRAFNNAMDILGDKKVDVDGKLTSELTALLVEAMRKDIVGAIKGLASIIPKNVEIDVTHRTHQATDLTDDELAMIIAERARARRELEQTIEADVLPDNTQDEAASG